MQLRPAMPADFAALGQVMFDAIRTGPCPYSEAQRAAWCPEPPGGDGWDDRLAQQALVMLVEDAAGPAGFMTLRGDGYIDLAFLLPRARGQGQFRQLFTAVEAKALDLGMAKLETHASLMAEAPFAKMGFAVVTREEVERAGQRLRRAQMRKPLRAVAGTAKRGSVAAAPCNDTERDQLA
ncbi:GNAT family N-acetyltransferase [Thalassococcus sp. BH17M4-6]|uniref:GNAT family N-acetyltransferase n=1 Tax=Thalassococcus sp. BH17M4-6 TaxID=3413148 RepID=UPI003BCCD78C